jgi:cold shock CspA family protein
MLAVLEPAARNVSYGTSTLEPHSTRNRFTMSSLNSTQPLVQPQPSLQPKSHGLWDIAPPPKVIEIKELDRGQVDTFFAEKGYGFMETAGGRLFFHASGFRVPRMVPVKKNGAYTQEIQLAQVRPKPKDVEAAKNSGPIPLPEIQNGMCLMFIAGLRNDRKQALTWCLQEMYEELLAQLTARYVEEFSSWRQLGRYKLELCERRSLGTMRADNRMKGFVPETRIVRTNLFEGTNVDYLKHWFRGCRDSYRLPPAGNPSQERWIELYFQVYDQGAASYGDWQLCDASTMNDFLG